MRKFLVDFLVGGAYALATWVLVALVFSWYAYFADAQSFEAVVVLLVGATLSGLLNAAIGRLNK